MGYEWVRRHLWRLDGASCHAKLSSLAQTTGLCGSSSSSLDFPGDSSPSFLWDFHPHPMDLVCNYHFDQDCAVLGLQVVRSSPSCPFSLFLFSCACPWVMLLHFHITMLPCCILLLIIISKIITYLFFFATKVYYKKSYICMFTNTNHLVFFHSNLPQGIY